MKHLISVSTKPAAGQLSELLCDKAATVREAVRPALAKLEPEVVHDLAAAALSGAPAPVRVTLAQVLGELGTDAAKATLAAHREGERSAEVRAMIDSFLSSGPTRSAQPAADAPEGGYIDAWDRSVALPDWPALEPDDGRAAADAKAIAEIEALEREANRLQDESHARAEAYMRSMGKTPSFRKREQLCFAANWVKIFNEPTCDDNLGYTGYDVKAQATALQMKLVARMPLARILRHAAYHYGAPGRFLLRGGISIFQEAVGRAVEDGDLTAIQAIYLLHDRHSELARLRPNMAPPGPEPLAEIAAEMLGDPGWRAPEALPAYLWPVAAQAFDLVIEKLPPRERDAKATLRAFGVIDTFPSLPKALVGPLLDTALDPRPRIARRAQGFLRDVPGIDATLIERLSDARQPVRAAAARMLAARDAVEAVPALEARLKKERAEAARGEMIAALAKLGDASAHLSPEALTAEARRLTAKLPTPGLIVGAVPPLRWKDCDDVDPVVPDAWLRLAVKLKTPLGVPLLSVWLDQLAPDSARAFSNHILETWLEGCFQKLDAKTAQKGAERHLSEIRRWQNNPHYHPPSIASVLARAQDTTNAQLLAELVAEHTQRTKVQRHEVKGMLALAGHADGRAFGARFSPWLKRHGGEVACAKALVDALHLMGSREAVQALVSTATRFRQKTVRALAEMRLSELAEARGWSEDQLADRSVPDAGFDADGRLELTVGEDAVYLAQLQDDLTLRLTNPAGKTVKSLPAKSDATGKEAKATLSAARKALKATAAGQTARMRDAMLIGRGWSLADWESDIAGHVLMRRLAQRLVWRGLDAEGAPVASFRPTPEGEVVDAQGDAADLTAVAQVEIAHAATLANADRTAWAEHLSDFEVTPLFVQIGRPVMAPPEGAPATRIEDRDGWKTTTFALRGAAAKLGYERGPIEDGGGFTTYIRTFQGAGLQAVLQFEGSAVNEEDWPCALGTMSFTRIGHYSRPVSLDRVPPILLSECWCDLHDIAAACGAEPV